MTSSPAGNVSSSLGLAGIAGDSQPIFPRDGLHMSLRFFASTQPSKTDGRTHGEGAVLPCTLTSPREAPNSLRVSEPSQKHSRPPLRQHILQVSQLCHMPKTIQRGRLERAILR